jgi:hypothetical protein
MDIRRHDESSERRNRFRRIGLAASAATATALGASGEASALIIHTVGSQGTGSTFQLDGATDYSRIELVLAAGMMGNPDSLGLDSPNGAMMGVNSTVQFLSVQPTPAGPRFLEELAGGATIGPSTEYAGQAWVTRNGDPNTTWTVGDEALIGFTFDTAAGATHYGWLRLKFDTASSFSISEWAWDNVADTPIFAGAVPEPGTAILLGLGLALLGGRLRWRSAPRPHRAHG